MVEAAVGKEEWESFKDAWKSVDQIGGLADDVAHYHGWKGMAELTGAKSNDEAILDFAQTYGDAVQDGLILTAGAKVIAQGGSTLLRQAGQYRIVIDRHAFGANGGNIRFVRKESVAVEVPRRVFNVKKQESSVWKEFKRHKNELRTNGQTSSKRRFYEWDPSHNDIEVYGPGGRIHLGWASLRLSVVNYVKEF